MKTKKIIAVFLTIILLAATGCRLAKEDTGGNSNSDRLIGVLITKEYLDLFDMEGYLNDNLKKITDTDDKTIDSIDTRYKGRLYATLTTRTLTDERTGKTFDTKEFVFEDIEGISYFAATVPATENEDSFITSGSDAAISDGHVALNYGDDEDKITLEGTIYVSPTHAGSVSYINPVYQSSDGSVYATSGSGFMVDGVHDEGSVYTQTLEETTTVTENGKSKTTYISVKISIATKFLPKQIVVLQMDKDSSIISKDQYVPGELPSIIKPDKDVEFIIVETYKNDREGNLSVSRSLFDISNESIETFYGRDDGFCIKQWTQLDWNNNKINSF